MGRKTSAQPGSSWVLLKGQASCHGVDTASISLRVFFHIHSESALIEKACRYFAHLGFFQCISDQKHPQSRCSVCKVVPLRLSLREERISDQKATSPIWGMLFSICGHHQMIQRCTASLRRTRSLCCRKQ